MFFGPQVLRSVGQIQQRLIHTSQTMHGDAFKKMLFSASDYRKYGLLQDDMNSSYDSVVVEAQRRLPEELRTKMIYRQIIASQLLLSKNILPKEQWTKYEENQPYLQPYIDEVLQEIEERKDWNAKY